MRLSLVLLVFVGGGIGSVARYAMATALQRTLPGPFPVGTFAVNLLGCFAIGLVGALGLERAAISPEA
ncbi:MAG: fluoride efflux transporter FluC, partial [Acidobacteriota bacterium]